jgi:hypothetical protein
MIFKTISKIRNQYILRNNPIDETLWQNITAKVPLLTPLTNDDLKRLKKLTTLFLHEKTFTGVKGFQLDDEKCLIIAAQACLPILNLDLSYYDGWVEIVVYPDTFVVYRNITDNHGLVHDTSSALSGEAWSRGPVILAWTDVERDTFAQHHGVRSGHNVVIHEFSHKLDMLNGRANGMPPLHPNMHRQDWTDSLNRAYQLLVNQIESYQTTTINEYAATNPAEFFAVISECFFTAPTVLTKFCPEVYEQLVLFYKQDPLN